MTKPLFKVGNVLKCNSCGHKVVVFDLFEDNYLYIGFDDDEGFFLNPADCYISFENAHKKFDVYGVIADPEKFAFLMKKVGLAHNKAIAETTMLMRDQKIIVL